MKKEVIAMALVASMCLAPVVDVLPVNATDSMLLNLTNKEYDDAVMLDEGVFAKTGNVFATMGDADEYSFVDYDGTETSLTTSVKNNEIDTFYLLTNYNYLQDSIIVVGQGDKKSTMNNKGEVLGEFEYDNAAYINEYVYFAEKDDMWSLYKTDGTLVENINSMDNYYQNYDDDWGWYRYEEGFLFEDGDRIQFYDYKGNCVTTVPGDKKGEATVDYFGGGIF